MQWIMDYVFAFECQLRGDEAVIKAQLVREVVAKAAQAHTTYVRTHATCPDNVEPLAIFVHNFHMATLSTCKEVGT
jgi:hypothetical protein